MKKSIGYLKLFIIVLYVVKKKVYRERRYTKKPKSFNKIQEWNEQYDYCEM